MAEKIDVHFEVLPPNTWIGDEHMRELARDNWVLHAVVQARDFGGNERAEGMLRYVFYKKTTV